jgi:hypothetical protein
VDASEAGSNLLPDRKLVGLHATDTMPTNLLTNLPNQFANQKSSGKAGSISGETLTGSMQAAADAARPCKGTFQPKNPGYAPVGLSLSPRPDYNRLASIDTSSAVRGLATSHDIQEKKPCNTC